MRANRGFSWSPAAAALALVLSACNGNSGLTSSTSGLPLYSASLPRVEAPRKRVQHYLSSSKIQHVVIIIQENRSFNNLFYGFPGATTTTYGYDTSGKKITLQPVPLEAHWDIEHNASSFFLSCNGTGSIPGTDCKMNGFDKETWTCGTSGHSSCPSNPPYAYVPQSETKPYFTMGEQYVVGDQMYASNLDASSFTAHQYAIAGQAEGAVNYPTGLWGCEGGTGDTVVILGPQRQIPYGREQVCFGDTTLGQEADKAGVSWASYSSAIGKSGQGWDGYQANRYVYDGSDWKKNINNPQTQFFNDVSNGKLPQITWVTPTCQNSDHADCRSNTGPQWVASLVNAIGQSKYWNSTAIFIFWDEFGGWYDPQPPAYVDYDGLGVRVPLIIVSPYAKKGYVSHVHYEDGSILRFVEDQFGLGRLAASDKRATSPEADCFNFNAAPRKFRVIPSALGKQYFMHQAPDLRPPDTE